jgi:hypothetical protein
LVFVPLVAAAASGIFAQRQVPLTGVGMISFSGRHPELPQQATFQKNMPV